MWLHSSVGRASHRYRGGHGFESRWSLDFFRLLLSNCLNWKIYCDGHSSLLRAIACKNGAIPRQFGKFGFSFIAWKRPFCWTTFRSILSKFQRVHTFVKSRKVRNTAQSTKMADGIYPNCTYSTRQYRKKGTCLDFIFTQFVINL